MDELNLYNPVTKERYTLYGYHDAEKNHFWYADFDAKKMVKKDLNLLDKM